MAVLSPDELDVKLAHVIKTLREAFSPVAIYLFGSYAYGTPGPHSDIDLLVVVEDSELTPYARDAAAYRALGAIGIPKDIQIYTRAEFEERAALAVSFERTVKQKGVLVYGT